jgi:Alpha amylase, C-terminal all-beta domain
MEGRQERVEPLDRAYELSSLGSEVEAVARGDRSMQQCRSQRDESGFPRPTPVVAVRVRASVGRTSGRRCGSRTASLRDSLGSTPTTRITTCSVHPVEPGTRAALVCLCNFSPVVGKDHRVGLPRAGRWVEVMNTDDAAYGGSDVPDMGWSGRRSSAGSVSPHRPG